MRRRLFDSLNEEVEIAIVEDEIAFANLVFDAAKNEGFVVKVFASVGAAMHFIDAARSAGRVIAMFVDVHLGEESGWSVVDYARRELGELPILVMSVDNDPCFAYLAHDRPGVCFMPKMPTRADGAPRGLIAQFFREARLADVCGNRRRHQLLLAGIADYARRARLAPAESEVLAGLVMGESAEAIARSRGTTTNTVEGQIASLLDKTNSPDRQTLVNRVLRNAFGLERELAEGQPAAPG